MNLRVATAADAEAIDALVLEIARYERLEHEKVATPADLADALERGLIEVHLVEHEGALVGYALTYTTFSTFRGRAGTWLEDLFVLPDHRGSGVGKILFEAVRKRAIESGHGRLEWSVLDWNENAIQFYEKLGATVLPDWRICRMNLPGG